MKDDWKGPEWRVGALSKEASGEGPSWETEEGGVGKEVGCILDSRTGI